VPDTVAREWAMTDEDQIRNLISRYFHHLDDRDYERWKALLTSDVLITINGAERWPPNVQIEGQRGQHISVNQIVEVEGDRASAVFDYFYIAEIGPPKYERLVVLSFGRYTDRFVREGEGWLISSVAMNVIYADRLQERSTA
jgi:hypothetical protein